MNETTINEILTLDSREVAEMVGKKHKDLLKDIRRYNEYLVGGDFPLSDFFLESRYFDINNQQRPCYLLTKKGCELVGNKMTGAKGVQFTAIYVQKFNEMEEQIKVPLVAEVETNEVLTYEQKFKLLDLLVTCPEKTVPVFIKMSNKLFPKLNVSEVNLVETLSLEVDKSGNRRTKDFNSSKLVDLMKRFKISQVELSKELGVSESAVSEWVNGKVKPLQSNLKALINYFNIKENHFDI